MKQRRFISPIIILAFMSSVLHACKNASSRQDLLVYNATIYTVDSAFSTAEAMVIHEGKIVATGKKETLLKEYDFSDSLDARGKFIYPGLIDAHAHFVGYATSLQRVNLVDTKSWDEVIEKTKLFAAANPSEWVQGRGWDQNDWNEKQFPDNTSLNELFPDKPVLLTRIDGHAAIANQKALELAGIRPGDQLTGGDIEVKDGKLTGLLIDNAIDLVSAKIPEPGKEELGRALRAAEKNCFEMGLTTIVDCGLSY